MAAVAFYRVVNDIWGLRLPDPLEHGYETEQDFRQALRRLVGRWRGRVGEAVGERHGFFLLRFHDTPGGRPDEAWFPAYILQEVDAPDYMSADQDETDEITKELDRIFGFE